MNKKIKDGLIIFALLAVITLAGWYCWKINKIVPVIKQPVATTTSEGEISDIEKNTTPPKEAISSSDFLDLQTDTSDWLAFQSEQYGYKFKYPKSWSVVKKTGISENNKQQTFVNSNEYKQEFLGVSVEYVGTGKSLEDLLSETWSQVQSLSFPTIEHKEERFANDLSVITVRTTVFQSKEPDSLNIYIIQDDRMYKIYHLSPDDAYRKDYAPIVYGIAHSFSLTEKVN